MKAVASIAVVSLLGSVLGVLAQEAAPAAPAGAAPEVVYQVNFDNGLPAKWDKGELTKENLPADSKGAVIAAVVEEKAQPIKADPAWVDGHFTIQPDLFFNCRLRMAKPEWCQLFVMTKEKGADKTDVAIYEGKPNVEGMQPNEWKVVSIPLADFKGTRGDRKDMPPKEGDICWTYFFDTQGRDLGLAVDRIWVTKGKAGDTPPAK